MNTLTLRVAAATLLTATCARIHAHEFAGRPDGHAPISVMGDHTHLADEWMLSYRFMTMDMDGNRDGSDRVRPDAVLEDYRVTPLDMTMNMHMFGLMYAPTDRLTLMGMAPYLDLEMDHLTRMGKEFTTESDGLGDIRLTGLWKLYGREHDGLHLNAGLSVPTGDIDATDDTPAGRSRLPYPMQLGSGTVDLLPGLTYAGYHERGSWGGQLNGTIRLDENDNDYTLGDRYGATAWASALLHERVTVSVRLAWETWEDVDGADPRLNPRMVPTADPELRGGERLDLGIGLNVLVGDGHRAAIEFLTPLDQDLDGPQLETDSTLVLGWQKSW